MRRAMVLSLGLLWPLLLPAARAQEEPPPAPPPAEEAPATPPAPAEEEAPAPPTPEEARREGHKDAYIEVLNDLLHDRTPRYYKQAGDWHARRGRRVEATTYYMLAYRIDPRQDVAAYEAAVQLAEAEQSKDLILAWLERAVKAGFWGAPELDDQAAFAPLREDPAFQALAARIRAAYLPAARAHAPPAVTVAPEGAPPATGWPVLVFLHGWGDNHWSYRDNAEEAAKLGWLGVAVAGTVPRTSDSFHWNEQAVEPTHRAVQAALQTEEKAGVKLDRARVFLLGFSQGATHAVRLVSDYPRDYAGALPISCGGSPELAAPQEPGRPRPVFAVWGKAEQEGNLEAMARLKGLWAAAKLPWQEHVHEGKHHFPEDWSEVHPRALEWLLKNAPPR